MAQFPPARGGGAPQQSDWLICVLGSALPRMDSVNAHTAPVISGVAVIPILQLRKQALCSHS